MTREEKQKAIDALKISAPVMAVTQEEFNDYIQTLNKIMDWLEQEPCDDAVSREAVINAICDYVALEEYEDKSHTFTIRPLEKRIKQLPSVTQKSETVTEFADRCRECGARYGKLLKQKSGKWIKVKSGDKDFPESIVCSRCSNENSHLDFNENAEPIGKVFITSKYCPNCGAKMESEE